MVEKFEKVTGNNLTKSCITNFLLRSASLQSKGIEIPWLLECLEPVLLYIDTEQAKAAEMEEYLSQKGFIPTKLLMLKRSIKDFSVLVKELSNLGISIQEILGNKEEIKSLLK